LPENIMTTNNTVRTITGRRRAPAAAMPVAGEVGRCRTVCSSCNLRELCAPCCGLSRSEKDMVDRLAFTRMRVRRGDSLYRTGDRFTSLYAVRSGFFKSVAALANGRDQVTGFWFAGEVMGMGGIEPEQHACDAIALEDSEVCAIPFAGLQQLAHEIPSLQHNLRKLMSREIVREHGTILQLGTMNAEERLAMFLLNLSRRFAAHGLPPSEFNLRMTREEIGSYLGLKLETVSRTFSRFQEEGLIAVQLKKIRIRDSAALERVMVRELA
jgi:CRP/FNR family transcriptional regulator